eukprot:scaffold15480_cov66-Phaeocystis_antarctica.AAC.5
MGAWDIDIPGSNGVKYPAYTFAECFREGVNCKRNTNNLFFCSGQPQPPPPPPSPSPSLPTPSPPSPSPPAAAAPTLSTTALAAALATLAACAAHVTPQGVQRAEPRAARVPGRCCAGRRAPGAGHHYHHHECRRHWGHRPQPRAAALR